jgi:hypothetical protein
MNRTIKRTSSYAALALCAMGCSGVGDPTYTLPAFDGGFAPYPPTPPSSLGGPVAYDAGYGVPEVCNQSGYGSCDSVLDTMCRRFAQCCQTSTACQPWATNIGLCKARFLQTGAHGAAPDYANRLVCPSVTTTCQNDVSLVACSDLASGTANWPPSCNAYWRQFGTPATTTTTTTPPAPPTAVALVAQNGKCMDVQSNQTANGTKIQLWQCNGTRAQSFRIEDVGGGAVRIVNNSSNKCVDVRSAQTCDGTPLQLWDCNGTGAQSFTYRYIGGQFSLVNTNSGRCVDIQSNRSDDGAPFQIWSCNGTGAQIFRTQTTNGVGTTGPGYTYWVDMTNNPYACNDKPGSPCGWSSSNNGQGYTCGRRHPDWANPWTCER